MGGVYSADGEVVVRRQGGSRTRSSSGGGGGGGGSSSTSAPGGGEPRPVGAAAAVKRRRSCDWRQHQQQQQQRLTHHGKQLDEWNNKRNHDRGETFELHYISSSNSSSNHPQPGGVRWSEGTAAVAADHCCLRRRAELIPRARLVGKGQRNPVSRANSISTSAPFTGCRHSRMFSSLESLPADNNNCTTEWAEWEVQVTRNGTTGQILTNGKPQLHKLATSPIVLETQTDNEDENQTIGVNKLTVNTEIEISELLEEREEEENQQNSHEPNNNKEVITDEKEDEQEEEKERKPRVMEDRLVKKNGEEEKKEEKEEGKEKLGEQEPVKMTNGSRKAIQEKPPVLGSRYDKVYRRKERPFGATYRRREQQQKGKLKQKFDDYGHRQQLTKEVNGDKEEEEEEDDVDEEKQKAVEEIQKIHETITSSPTLPPQETTYYEDEYCYEPEKKLSTSKTVLRTRSMINLDADEAKPFVRKTLSDALVADCKHTTDNNKMFNGNNCRSNGDAKFRYLNAFNSRSTANISTLPPSGVHRAPQPRAALGTRRQMSSSTLSLRRRHESEEDEEGDDEQNDKEEQLRRKLRHLLANDRLVITEPRRNTALDTATLRRCFYHPVRVNRELIDEELPDPDQVKLARDKFEKVLKIRGPDAPRTTNTLPPLTRTASDKRPTPEIRVPQPPPASTVTPKWTDSGSLSSGVSSGADEDSNSSCGGDDDLHQVSSEIMNRIRACGTTVTYYGGKVISQSCGPPSPLTSTIMEEIKFRLEIRDRMQFHEEFATNGEH